MDTNDLSFLILIITIFLPLFLNMNLNTNPIKYIFYSILFGITLLSSCNEPETVNTPPDLTCNGKVKSRDLPGIQSCTRNNWGVVYSVTNGTKTNHNNSFIKISNEDSIHVYINGNYITNTTTQWELKGQYYNLVFQDWNKRPIAWRITAFAGDTLMLEDSVKQVTYALLPAIFAPVMNCSGLLRDKSLKQIKYCITGYWQMHYLEGGVFNIREELTNSFVDFKPNDSIYYIDQGQLTVKDKVTWNRVVYSALDSTYVSHFYDWRSYPYSWVIDHIENDTLVFSENSIDGFRYHSTLKK